MEAEGRHRGSGTSSKIIRYALPKGTEKLCELCQKRAHLQCTKCQVTFYCDAEHQQADWKGIHEKICQLLVPIRTSTLSSLQRAGRIENRLKKTELIEICRAVAQRKISEGKHQEALPAAQFCLQCSIDVYGPCTVQLVPAYLLLADANMGLGNLDLVTEILSKVKWVMLKSPDCAEMQHRVHRSLGRLHTATGNLEQAQFHFGNDIYFASEEYGVDSKVTCGGFFLMADVFAKQGKMLIVRSLYSQVAETLHSHLAKLFETHMSKAPQNPSMWQEPGFENAQQVEVDKMLRTILEFEQNDSRKDSVQIALVAHCLAMLWLLREDSTKALEFGSLALQASQQIPNHYLTEPIQALLQSVQQSRM